LFVATEHGEVEVAQEVGVPQSRCAFEVRKLFQFRGTLSSSDSRQHGSELIVLGPHEKEIPNPASS
jgi:hypothetical protein